MIAAANHKKKRIGSKPSFIDPALFSKAIRNTQLSEDSFGVIVEYMKTNGIPISDHFLLNAFQSLLCSENNINSLLDIIDYFSEDLQVSGEYWRCFMNILSQNKEAAQDAYDSIRRYSQSNRHSLLYTLFRYFKQDKISFSFAISKPSCLYYTDLLLLVNDCNRMRFERELDWLMKKPCIV